MGNKNFASINGIHVTADTKYGRVCGKIENGIQKWFGIPYADNTSGKNRWKAPQDPRSWDETLEASNPREDVIQFTAGNVKGEESELRLDIYRPDSDITDLPVLVYVHGGNNQGGNSAEISGESFVSTHDAVVVCINYRLGVLGFNPLPALKHGNELENSGNFALLDIAKGLDWVKENIECFGGNPNNITLAGFSGGARDVTAGLISSSLRGKFHKAVSFSGGMTVAPVENSQKVYADAFARFLIEDKRFSDIEEAREWLLQDNDEVREYLYDLPAERCISAIGDAGIRMKIFPHLYADGEELPEEGFESDDYYDVPYMLYTGKDEFSLFALMDPAFKQFLDERSLSIRDMEAKKYLDFLTYIGSRFYALLNVQESLEHIALRNDSKVYGVQLDYGLDSDLAGIPLRLFGAFHGSHEQLIDINDNFNFMVGNGYKHQGTLKMARIFQDYLYNFMLTGNPNGEDLPHWKAWNEEESVLHLDADENEAYALNKIWDYDYDDVLDEIGAYEGISDGDKEFLVKNVLNGRWWSKGLDIAYDNLDDFYVQ